MTPGADPEVELAERFAGIARLLLAEKDVEQTLASIIDLTLDTIDHCEHAGINQVVRRKIESLVQSDDVPTSIDQMQVETDEGPCLDAIREHEMFVTGRLSAEDRWPNFAPRAYEETGVESILSFRLFIEEDTMGSLNLYSSQPEAFDEHDIAVGAVFAAHAAVALKSARERASLQEAVESRDVIGQAKGILMARQHIGEHTAFEQLKAASQHLNLKLRDVAAGIVSTESQKKSPG